MTENVVATVIAAVWLLCLIGPFIAYAAYMQWREWTGRGEDQT